VQEEPQEDGWMPVLAASELLQGKPITASAAGVDIFLYRTAERIFALANRCSHQGGPLHKGVVKPSGSNPTVTCPIHGSVFRLEDGRAIRGPAVAPQAVYEARISGDRVEVRPA
jgi:nitrite reductase/ring-hydroxylating ferredoxin subunit